MKGEAQAPYRSHAADQIFTWEIALGHKGEGEPGNNDETDAPEDVRDAGVLHNQADEPESGRQGKDNNACCLKQVQKWHTQLKSF